MKPYSFSLKNKLLFLIKTVTYKLLLFRDVKKGVIPLYLAEVLWYFNVLVRLKYIYKRITKIDFFVTKFGKFYVYPDIMSLVILSPAFERLDIDKLIDLVGKDVKNGKKVLFLDVGAYFGLYSVAIANRWREYKKNLDIIAFEPNASRFKNKNYILLKKNVDINHASNTKILNVGLGSTDAKKMNSDGFKAKKLDSILSTKVIEKYDVIYIKIDIEGFEREALEGGARILKQAKNIVLLIEDCVDRSIIDYLQKTGYTFYEKLTPYNSFWVK